MTVAIKPALAIDTFSSAGQLAIVEPSNFSSTMWGSEESHSEIITSRFVELTSHLDINSSAFSKIYLVVGPGSFTGLRVGINVAKSLAYSYDIPVVPLNALWALAYSSPDNGPTFSSIDAQRNRVYGSYFSKTEGSMTPSFENKILSIEDCLLSIDENTALVGPGWGPFQSHIEKNLEKIYFSWSPNKPKENCSR